MGWFVLYLLSVIIVPTIYAAIVADHSDEEIRINSLETAFGALFFCLLWPITITKANYVRYRAKLIRTQMNRCRDIVSRWRFDMFSAHDRSTLVDVPEADLKFLLKCYRKKLVNMDNKVLEMIREELLNRNLERSLLK